MMKCFPVIYIVATYKSGRVPFTCECNNINILFINLSRGMGEKATCPPSGIVLFFFIQALNLWLDCPNLEPFLSLGTKCFDISLV